MGGVRTWIAAIVLVVIAAFTTACGNGDPQGARGELTWGETYHDAVAIRVGTPGEFETSREDATPRGREAWRVVVAVRNESPDPFPLSRLRVGATSDGIPQGEVVDPFHGCNGLTSSGPVMPGQTVAVMGCWTGGNEPRSVTFTLMDSLRSVTFSD